MMRVSCAPVIARRSAFTLLEVLVAIALMLALGGAMFGFLHDMLATRGRTMEHSARQRAASTLIERLEGDACTCIVGDSRHGSGVRGDERSLRLLTRGVMSQIAARGLHDPAAMSDLHVVEYRFDESTRRLQAGRAPWGESVDFAPLGGSIARMRFRYLDGRRWLKAFDSLELNRLPAAIEVAVWYTSRRSSVAELHASKDASTQPQVLVDEIDDDGGLTIEHPLPDRVRVIVIPDGGAAASSGGES